MGCDIHVIAQRRAPDPSNESGLIWETLEWPVQRHEYPNPMDPDQPYIDCDRHPFDWRSYWLYGWLADVRNYSDVKPIAPARGLPKDMKGYDDYTVENQ